MEKFPILPYPDFLSQPIQHYIAEISGHAGRLISFGDHRWLRAQQGTFPSVAALLSPPDWPCVIIYLDSEQINRSLYDPEKHDPIIAHEITHLKFLSEGWHRMLPNENVDNETREKIRTIENWLTDPLINISIAQRGFSLDTERSSFAVIYTQNLKAIHLIREQLGGAKIISSLNVQTREQEAFPVGSLFESQRMEQTRLFVSLSLESGLSLNTKQSLNDAFEQAFPEFVETAKKLLTIISANGFDTPEKYAVAAMLCLQEWRIDRNSFRFEPHKKFSLDSQRTWISTFTRTDGIWKI